MNALAAFAVGIQAGMKPETIVAALPGYQPSGMRQKIVDCRGIMVVEDCYNASPDSMRTSLGVLRMLDIPGKRAAVLGDMLELGRYSEQAHRDVGRMAAESGVDRLLYRPGGAFYCGRRTKKRQNSRLPVVSGKRRAHSLAPAEFVCRRCGFVQSKPRYEIGRNYFPHFMGKNKSTGA